MKAPKSINVYLREGRHATQPWTFTIDRPGSQNKETKSERYARLFTAKRGALRMLGGQEFGTTLQGGRFYVVLKGSKLTPITFYVIRQSTPKRVTKKIANPVK